MCSDINDAMLDDVFLRFFSRFPSSLQRRYDDEASEFLA
jgi:hypothetical protein